jgi:hypothetical protein
MDRGSLHHRAVIPQIKPPTPAPPGQTSRDRLRDSIGPASTRGGARYAGALRGRRPPLPASVRIADGDRGGGAAGPGCGEAQGRRSGEAGYRGIAAAIIYKNERTAYLAYLRRADSGDCGAVAEFLLRAILQNLYKFIVLAVAGPSRIVPLAALASDRISANALRTAATRGALVAVKGPDGQWRSSKRWVEDYLRSRHQRGRRPVSG